MTPSESGTVVSYPIPAYQNLPIKENYYEPSRFVISGITLGNTTTITTSTDMNYVVGQEVRLLVPSSFGSYQLNNRTGFVVDITGADEFVVDIDSSRNVDPYISSDATTVAQVLAIGDVNLGYTNDQGNINNITFIPGSFINISPE